MNSKILVAIWVVSAVLANENKNENVSFLEPEQPSGLALSAEDLAIDVQSLVNRTLDQINALASDPSLSLSNLAGQVSELTSEQLEATLDLANQVQASLLIQLSSLIDAGEVAFNDFSRSISNFSDPDSVSKAQNALDSFANSSSVEINALSELINDFVSDFVNRTGKSLEQVQGLGLTASDQLNSLSEQASQITDSLVTAADKIGEDLGNTYQEVQQSTQSSLNVVGEAANEIQKTIQNAVNGIIQSYNLPLPQDPQESET